MTEHLRRTAGAFADLGERAMPVVEPLLTLVVAVLLAAPVLLALLMLWIVHPVLEIFALGLLAWPIVAVIGGDDG